MNTEEQLQAYKAARRQVGQVSLTRYPRPVATPRLSRQAEGEHSSGRDLPRNACPAKWEEEPLRGPEKLGEGPQKAPRADKISRLGEG